MKVFPKELLANGLSECNADCSSHTVDSIQSIYVEIYIDGKGKEKFFLSARLIRLVLNTPAVGSWDWLSLKNV